MPGPSGSGERRGPPRRKAALPEEGSTQLTRVAIAKTGVSDRSVGGEAVAVLGS